MPMSGKGSWLTKRLLKEPNRHSHIYIVTDLLLRKDNGEYCCFSTIQLLFSCHVRAHFQEKSKHIGVISHHDNSLDSDLDDKDMIHSPKNTKYVVLFYYEKNM